VKLALVVLTSGSVSGGVVKHLRHVVPLLLEDVRVTDLRIFVPEGAIDGLPPQWPLAAWPASSALGRRRFLKRKLAEFGPDVVFVPSARWLRANGRPTVVMVRNMEPLEAPFASGRLPEKLRALGRRLVARHACRRADRIIAVSGHVRDFLVSQWSLPAAKIAVVPHGVEAPPEPSRPGTLDGLPEAPFIFTAGSIRPARGLTDLIAALADGRVPAELQLVVAGRTDAGTGQYYEDLLALARRLGVIGRIHWAGQLNPSQMSWCFRNAALFVTTSRVEACPNTVLEAIGHGTLSVSGDNAPMPEFFGDSALYYRIGNAGSLAGAIAKALALPVAEQARLRELARTRAALYSWERTAADTVSELLKAVSPS
jgi:glycosyltransferase involved in cell wall biosynthesis